ncbi:MAG: TusE/DsrC/DsvC family sulfur relay protein [Planctomycetes bacterium]|nr:TusE/DsrC/DsvC family sulfur relay protein [Planctomycetota bacterium]
MRVDDRTIEFDADGFMKEPRLWNRAVAMAIAREEGIEELTDRHWTIVEFIRSYWEREDLAPPVRVLCKESGVTLRDVYRLFRAGPARGACRIAGLPKPDGCV